VHHQPNFYDYGVNKNPSSGRCIVGDNIAILDCNQQFRALIDFEDQELPLSEIILRDNHFERIYDSLQNGCIPDICQGRGLMEEYGFDPVALTDKMVELVTTATLTIQCDLIEDGFPCNINGTFGRILERDLRSNEFIVHLCPERFEGEVQTQVRILIVHEMFHIAVSELYGLQAGLPPPERDFLAPRIGTECGGLRPACD